MKLSFPLWSEQKVRGGVKAVMLDNEYKIDAAKQAQIPSDAVIYDIDGVTLRQHAITGMPFVLLRSAAWAQGQPRDSFDIL